MIDSGAAVAYVVYECVDHILILNGQEDTSNNNAITLFKQWKDQKIQRKDGVSVHVSTLVNPAATFMQELVASQHAANRAVFMNVNDLVKVVPALYHLASAAASAAANSETSTTTTTTVIHASASSLVDASSSHLLSVTAHISPLVVILSAQASVQETHDTAHLAHTLAKYLKGVPVLVVRPQATSEPFASITHRELVHSKPGEESKVAKDSIEQYQRVWDHAVSDLKLDASTSFFEYTGHPHAELVLVMPGTFPRSVEDHIHELVSGSADPSLKSVGVVRVRVFRPWSSHHFLAAIPKSAKHIAVVDVSAQHASFGPLFLDVAASFQAQEGQHHQPHIQEARVKLPSTQTFDKAAVTKTLKELHAKGASSSSHFDVTLSQESQHSALTASVGIPLPSSQKEVDVDQAYIDVLHQYFKGRLALTNVLNGQSLTRAPESGERSLKDGTSAEFGLGIHLAEIQERDRFIASIIPIAKGATTPKDLSDALKAWIHAPESPVTRSASAIASLGAAALRAWDNHLNSSHPPSELAKSLKDLHHAATTILPQQPPARWVLGGDRLSYDVGTSGVHHVVSSKANVKILVLDTQTYTEKKNEGDKRKKDVGLYAMTYGGTYVASVALHSSYAGVVRAFEEADAFDGPAVILAYAPRMITTRGGIVRGGGGVAATATLAALKETKLAVDDGTWPLYRWKPAVAVPGGDLSDPEFNLDSEVLRGELQAFLERSQHLSLVANTTPSLSSAAVPQTIEAELRKEAEQKIDSAYQELLAGLNSQPVLILYGSDGGNATNVAKKLSGEARQRGLRPKVAIMDQYTAEDIQKHKHILFVVSTAGQGEFPGNARELWKSLAALKAGAEGFGEIHYSVFAMGDSHYWPLPADAHYFCKSGKDLDAHLATLGAHRLHSVGLGDDRAADGYMTAYRDWTAEVWTALGVGGIEVSDAAAAAAAPTDDAIKIASNFLRGSIAPGLEDTSTGALSEFDTKITKFHGIYQQDDRDLRDARARVGLEKAFSFMVRVRVPGGVSSPAQWIAVDEISDARANGTIKLTTRQAFQFHGIVKKNLKKAIQEINQALMDTIAACGDVNRNVMCNPNPHSDAVHAQVLEFTRKFSDHLTPQTGAYHEIWLDKKVVVTSEDIEPIYGKTYLPRKFKVAVAVPPHNDVDVLAHDLGYIAISEGDRLIGFNVTVGGGMGMTHGMKATYPRIADILGFCTVEQAVAVGEQVVTVQRDYGDRLNRKHARLKYTIDDRGIDWFRGEVEKRLGYKLQPAKPYKFVSNADRYGWIKGTRGTWSYGMFIQNGRVKDTPERNLKTGLRELADLLEKSNQRTADKTLHAEFRLSPNQNLIIANISDRDKAAVEAILSKHKLENGRLSGLRLNSMACVALPTCALAMAESERYLPDLVGKIELVLEEHGLRDDAITIRMTGCPNGCARPQIAEIAFVGKAPGTYNMYLGGGHNGERLNKIVKESVTEPEILELLAPIIKDYAHNKRVEEHFGDFVIRKGYVKATLKGKDFHDV